MSHHTAIDLLKAELKDAEARAIEVKTDTKDAIDEGKRAENVLYRANSRVDDLKRAIAALEKDGRGVEVTAVDDQPHH